LRAWCNNFRLRFRGGLNCLNRRSFLNRALSSFDDSHAALNGSLFFGEVLVSNLLCQLFRNRVGRDANVDTFAAHLFNETLGVEFQFFGEIVKTNLRGNGHALLFRR
jgi:hypothetical protein